MRSDDAAVAVARDGHTLGLLTPDSVHRALRRSVAETVAADG
jgi:hypothetical protein